MVLTKPISYGRRISMLANQHPEKTAIVFAPHHGREICIDWNELDKRSNQTARLLAEHGVNQNAFVVVGLQNCPEHFFAIIGAWKLGALVLPLRSAMPTTERERILTLAQPTLIVADWENTAFPTLNSSVLEQADDFSGEALPDVVPHPGKTIGSGGSTGLPKIIVNPHPWAFVPGQNVFFSQVGWTAGMAQLVAGPLYHNAPFSVSHLGLFDDHTLILMERFDAAKAVNLVENHRVSCGFLAPTMMKRIASLPGVAKRDWSSIESIYHTAAPCPAWLKRQWIDLIGPEHLYEAFGTSEDIGVISIRGDEWLKHPGSLGKPRGAELRILDGDGHEVPPGQVGEIFMRAQDATGPNYRYIGAPALPTTPDGLASVGDMGWVDEDGYLFLADRRVDLIISGGENVYPAEVEAVLSEHGRIADVVVIGIPDEEWGKRVHAVIQPHDRFHRPSVSELNIHCRERLVSYKIPKSYEFVEQLPREPSGKIRRSALVEQRTERE